MEGGGRSWRRVRVEESGRLEEGDRKDDMIETGGLVKQGGRKWQGRGGSQVCRMEAL